MPKQLTVFVLASRVDLVDPHLVNYKTKSNEFLVFLVERRQRLTQNEEDNVVAEASQAVQQRHLDDEPVHEKTAISERGGTRPPMRGELYGECCARTRKSHLRRGRKSVSMTMQTSKRLVRRKSMDVPMTVLRTL